MRFRVFVDPPADGPRNMAIDEALFRFAADPPCRATLRIYSFQPPTVSYGYRQTLLEAVDLAACRELGIGWVRRPTGGRALLHQHELTYSVVAPVTGPLSGRSVREVYELVHGGIRTALLSLGVPLDGAAESGREGRTQPALDVPCLAAPEPHEITARGKKLVPSAQRRSREAFLQHGSILFRIDHELWDRIAPPGGKVPLAAIGLEDLLPTPPTPSSLSRALQSAFEVVFESEAEPEGLDRRERTLVESLVPRYRSGAFPALAPIG